MSTTLKNVSLALLLGSQLSAAALTWQVAGVFNNGGVLAGSYQFDASTGQFSNINVTATGDSVFPNSAFILDNPGLPSTAGALDFVTTTGNLTGTPFLSVVLSHPMTASGGIIPITGSALANCFNSTCSASGSLLGVLKPGGTVSAQASPELPGSTQIVSGGLALVWLTARRRLRIKQTQIYPS